MFKPNKTLFSPVIYVLALAMMISCQSNVKSTKKEEKNMSPRLVEWSRNANIYEVNIRQYTEEGTLTAFMEHLPRLKAMGVDILWIMPVFPVGELNRKGSLGSYYAVKDYKDINPEFGNIQDFKNLVKEAHALGMYVILDWVANHSAWDNPWAAEHPEWYQRGDDGNFVSPFDWSDVIAFDYNNPVMRDSMIDALKFWITEADIDGYRCDVAGMVPTDFWDRARDEMNAIKPVFMLAEDEDNPDLLRKAFDMNYGWKLHHMMNDIAKGEKNASEIWGNLDWNNNTYPSHAYRMYFITNHDENSWNGTVKERMGEAGKAFAVLSYTLPGMPLIYSGQEAGNEKRLRFFEKDTIDWNQVVYEDFYTTLNKLKKENPALWNGESGGHLEALSRGNHDQVFAFSRVKDDHKVLCLINLSDQTHTYTLHHDQIAGNWWNAFKKEEVQLSNELTVELKPWDYLVLSSK